MLCTKDGVTTVIYNHNPFWFFRLLMGCLVHCVLSVGRAYFIDNLPFWSLFPFLLPQSPDLLPCLPFCKTNLFSGIWGWVGLSDITGQMLSYGGQLAWYYVNSLIGFLFKCFLKILFFVFIIVTIWKAKGQNLHPQLILYNSLLTTDSCGTICMLIKLIDSGSFIRQLDTYFLINY